MVERERGEMKFNVKTLEDLPRVAKEFLEITKGYTKYAFNGEMGAGKTTFIKAILREMGVLDPVSSPTFSIVNSYESNQYGEIFHFDFYRLEDEQEAYAIGADELFDSSAYCFIEWPSKVDNLLPENYVPVTIAVQDDCRIIKLDL